MIEQDRKEYHKKIIPLHTNSLDDDGMGVYISEATDKNIQMLSRATLMDQATQTD